MKYPPLWQQANGYPAQLDRHATRRTLAAVAALRWHVPSRCQHDANKHPPGLARRAAAGRARAARSATGTPPSW